MSNDDNSKDSIDLSETLEDLKDKTTEMAGDAVDAISEKAEDVAETISEVVDDASEVVSDVVDDVSDAKDSAVAKIMELKDSNPKVFFGGIGAVVLVVLILMMSGGSSTKSLPVAKNVNLAVGQTYTLKGVNTTDPSAKIRLVAVPGSMAAFDDTEGEDDACKRITQGTKVKATQIQSAFGQTKFVEVEMVGGDCAGRKGWVISTNLN